MARTASSFHTGLSGHQHREIGWSDQFDLAPQVLHRRTAADQLAGARPMAFQHHVLGDQSQFFGLVFQCFDQIDSAHMRTGQGGNGLDEPKIEGAEQIRIQSVGRQGADQDTVGDHGTTHAGVDAPGRCIGMGQQSVEGIRQPGIAGKAHGPIGIADDVQARMILAPHATAHGVGGEAGGGHGHQGVAFKAQ
jgi:hypothetical protein